MKQIIRGIERALRKSKRRRAPLGGGFTAAAKRSQVNKGYAGVPRALKPRVKTEK